VAKAARRKTTSSKEREINKRAIRELRAVSDVFSWTVSGIDLAKEARALERALAAPNSRKATTQRRVQSFAQAAAKYSPPDRVMKRVAKKAAARKDKKGREKQAGTLQKGCFSMRGRVPQLLPTR
jgi:hypothetical protein